MEKYKSFFLGLFLLLTIITFAQKKSDDRSGFSYGIGLGVCKASGKNALYYNGSPDKLNAIVSVIGNPNVPIGSSEQSTQSQVYSVLRDDIIGIQYPSKMTYNPAVTLQGYLSYVFENKDAVFAQLQYSKLSTNGVFSIELASPDSNKIGSSTNQIVNGGIKASENRTDIEFGYHWVIDKKGITVPFFEVFGNVNSVAVKSHDMNITTRNGTFSQSLIHYTVNTINTNQVQGGMGYGFGATFGIEAPAGKIRYNVGLKGSLKTIQLLDNPELTPHFELFARILH